MKKRVLSLLLALMMVIGLLPMTAQAGTLDNGLVYEVYEDHVEITDYTGGSLKLVIPAEIDGLPVTTIADYAFSTCSKLTNITIPDSVITIGDRAFYVCSRLSTITIPDSVISIGDGAFYQCSALTSVNLSNSVTSIDDYTFYGCSRLTSIDIPDGVTSIGLSAFFDCINMSSISIPDSVTSIGAYAFTGCPMKSITIPDSVTYIGRTAFANCTKLTSICFKGDAPAFGTDVFSNVTATVDYPDYNETWTVDVMQDYGGTITWVAYHDHEYEVSVTAPTCTEQGFTSYSCICGDSYVSDYTDTLGHSFENGICTRCCAISYDFFGQDEEVTRGKMCYLLWAMNGCPEPSDTTHDYVDLSEEDYYYTAILWALENRITTGVTNTKFNPDGICTRSVVVAFLWRNADCPDPTSANNPFKDVVKSDYFYEAVLWADEQNLQIANVCNDEFRPYFACTYDLILGEGIIHYKVKLPVTPATCTETGLTEGVKCADCGEILVTQEIIPAMGHTEEIVPAVPATCTKNGLTEGKICSICGEILLAQNVVEAQGHAYESVVTAPTCIEDGYTVFTCSICGDSYVADETEALGHTEEIIPGVAPNCSESGLTDGKKCSVCGAIIVAQEEIPALGHDWNGISCQRCDATRENPFTDVPDGSFYIDPVLWAVENEITNGTSATSFNPNGQCQRAQVVTFLWRAFGCPEPTSSINPFADVKEGDFFYKPVRWAVENGITNGIDSTHFGSFAYCNRAQVVTFLWRANGSPKPSPGKNPFADVDKGSFYIDPVLWAVENGITNGIDATTFGVDGICNRAQVVTFLYRAYN